MASEWQDVSLGDLFKVKHGFAFKSEYFTDEPQETVLVTPGNFAVGGGFQDEKRKYYRGPVPQKYVLNPGEVVVTMTDLSKESDTLGYAAIIPNNSKTWLHNQRIGLLEFNPELPTSPRFVQYLLRTHEYRAWIIGSATGTTVKHTSPGRIESFATRVPPIEEQRAISCILGALDSRIDNNRALAAKLEAIARRLFKSWFVDFDPVGAKAVGEKPAGLVDDLAALFPDRFEGSELGDTPDGWKVGKISDFSTNVRVGCTPRQFSSEDFYVGLEHFDRRCLTLWNGGSGDDASSNKSRFSKGDLLFGKLRPYFHKVAIAPRDGICSTDILVIRCADSAYREFMYLSLFQDEVIQYVSDASGGTRMPRTNWETLAGYACVIPSRPVALAFGEIVAPMIETMMQCISENAALTKIRDLLLPRLISGKLRVSDAESLIEEAIA